jgi:predicted 3-demethylubiquinone-9 3-methyltransferase (glyoxalase superfamily)
MADADRVRAKRVTDAMMKMVKFEIATPRNVHAGAVA